MARYPPLSAAVRTYLKAFDVWLHAEAAETEDVRYQTLHMMASGRIPVTLEEEFAARLPCAECGGPILDDKTQNRGMNRVHCQGCAPRRPT